MKKVIKVDIIEEANPGVGVTVGGVTLKNGTVSGMSTTSQYIYFTDPVSGLKSRFGARDNNPVFDREIIPNGFTGIEGVGWQNVGGGTNS
jgi:hypothetical protein